MERNYDVHFSRGSHDYRVEDPTLCGEPLRNSEGHWRRVVYVRAHANKDMVTCTACVLLLFQEGAENDG